MIVMKFGGSSIRDRVSIRRVAEIIKENSFSNRIVVVSAVFGVTDKLEMAIQDSVSKEDAPEKLIENLKEIHHSLAYGLMSDSATRARVLKRIDSVLNKCMKILKGVFYTGEATPRVRDSVLSTGERLSSFLIAGVLEEIGVKAVPVETDVAGMLAQGQHGQGTAVLEKVRENLHPLFDKMLSDNELPVVTGYFGVNDEGNVITFGRGGSDYSAAVLARALDAQYLEIWKDVKAFLTGTPDLVENAKLISELSYDEAAELAYFGAKILHPRTVEPLLEKEIPIVIRSTFHPESSGTWIRSNSYLKETVAKSVTYDLNAGILKIYGPNIGYSINLLSEVAAVFNKSNLNIRSVFTSQTCINVLFNKRDVKEAYQLVQSYSNTSIEHVEKIECLGLVAIVGHGMNRDKNVVAEALLSLTEKRIHVELIISGASEVASYFLVKESDVTKAVKSIHNRLFSKKEIKTDTGEEKWLKLMRR